MEAWLVHQHLVDTLVIDVYSVPRRTMTRPSPRSACWQATLKQTRHGGSTPLRRCAPHSCSRHMPPAGMDPRLVLLPCNRRIRLAWGGLQLLITSLAAHLPTSHHTM